jgi:hypothetical protein
MNYFNIIKENNETLDYYLGNLDEEGTKIFLFSHIFFLALSQMVDDYNEHNKDPKDDITSKGN